MELLIYREEYDLADSIQNFLHFYYSLSMNYLASDLLHKGLSPNHITSAVLRAIKIVESSGIEVHRHFMPVFTQVNKEIIQDCKLSKLGYGLVLMNANPKLPVVGEWQIKVLKGFLN